MGTETAKCLYSLDHDDIETGRFVFRRSPSSDTSLSSSSENDSETVKSLSSLDYDDVEIGNFVPSRSPFRSDSPLSNSSGIVSNYDSPEEKPNLNDVDEENSTDDYDIVPDSSDFEDWCFIHEKLKFVIRIKRESTNSEEDDDDLVKVETQEILEEETSVKDPELKAQDEGGKKEDNDEMVEDSKEKVQEQQEKVEEEEDEFYDPVITYDGRNILDLGANLQGRSFFSPAIIPKFTPDNYWDKRSLYHRLSPYGTLDEFGFKKCDCCDFYIPYQLKTNIFIQN